MARRTSARDLADAQDAPECTVCPECGLSTMPEAPETCPVDGTAGAQFERIDRPRSPSGYLERSQRRLPVLRLPLTPALPPLCQRRLPGVQYRRTQQAANRDRCPEGGTDAHDSR